MGLKLKRGYVVSYYVLLLLALLGMLFYSNIPSISSPSVRELSQYMRYMEEIDALLQDVQGDDYRIMRWDASEHTVSRQGSNKNSNIKVNNNSRKERESGGCVRENMIRAMEFINMGPSLPDQLRGRAAEYLTFCVTDNPTNRAILGEQNQNGNGGTKGIHESLVQMASLKSSLASITTAEHSSSRSGSTSSQKSLRQTRGRNGPELDPTSYASAMACQLIYIASFNNDINHKSFQQAGAVPILSLLVKNYKPDDVTAIAPIQVMWASAALQNLAASYCNHTRDGRCRWDWKEDEEVLFVKSAPRSHSDNEDGGGSIENEDRDTRAEDRDDDNVNDDQNDYDPVSSDGSAVRELMSKDTELLDRLIELACTGPVSESPFPGVNAIVHRDELSPNIIPWAAAGALKNAAIRDSVRAYIHEHHYDRMKCFCQLSHSRDWLESNKGEGLIFMLRRSDPCWFEEPPIEYGKVGATKDTHVCVDDIFYDTEGYTCSDYDEDPSEEDCSIRDRYNTVARDACCACRSKEANDYTDSRVVNKNNKSNRGMKSKNDETNNYTN